MKNLSIKGVVIGGVTDIVATNILIIPVIAYAVVKYGLASTPEDQLQAALLSTIQAHPLLYAVQAGIGSFCSILGGYVAARVAKRGEVLNGALSSFLCVASGIYSLAAGNSTLPLVQHLLWLVASPAFGALGGYLRLRQLGTNVSQP